MTRATELAKKVGDHATILDHGCEARASLIEAANLLRAQNAALVQAQQSLEDQIQWVHAFAKGQGDASHRTVRASPRMGRAKATLATLKELTK
ncbi:hypothetical protein [Caldimonas sp. KR1-144]|uniref:hypothetical protein n=1 Tax=Caldimonas sp. KR1-144 TaxID=3400911 RepID=UPI003C01E139